MRLRRRATTPPPPLPTTTTTATTRAPSPRTEGELRRHLAQHQPGVAAQPAEGERPRRRQDAWRPRSPGPGLRARRGQRPYSRALAPAYSSGASLECEDELVSSDTAITMRLMAHGGRLYREYESMHRRAMALNRETDAFADGLPAARLPAA
eukprot:2488358-Prymnesium_polylepis.1